MSLSQVAANLFPEKINSHLLNSINSEKCKFIDVNKSSVKNQHFK